MTARTTVTRGGFLAAVGLVLGVSLAAAEPAPVVLEMYTAQGCAACPPADEVFARYADDPNVIALALHVDYWDYLGWQDSFASPAFTERQKAYARVAQAKMIYTPQVIVAGKDRVQGTKAAEIDALIAQYRSEKAAVILSAEYLGRKLSVEAEAPLPLPKSVAVHLVRYMPSQQVSIEDGENAGHEINYRNIVTDWRTIAEWDGHSDLELEAELKSDITEDLPLVIILQQVDHGPVLAAALLD